MAEIKRSSLVDDSFESVGKGKTGKKSKKSSGVSADTLKIGMAIIFFIIAGLGIAYSQGVFEPEIKPIVVSPVDEKAAAASQKATDALMKLPTAATGGS